MYHVNVNNELHIRHEGRAEAITYATGLCAILGSGTVIDVVHYDEAYPALNRTLYRKQIFHRVIGAIN